MDESTIERLITIIREAYREYPAGDSTVNTMIDQALRIGYQRGRTEADKEPDWVNDFGV